jgi:hypothetical protein
MPNTRVDYEAVESARDDPASMTFADVDRAHATPVVDPVRDEIVQRYEERGNTSTPGPQPAEEAATEAAAAEEKCPVCGKMSKQLRGAIERAIKTGTIDSSVAHLVSGIKDGRVALKALGQLLIEDSEISRSANNPGLSHDAGAPQVRRGDALVPSGLKGVAASRLALQGNNCSRVL